MLKVFEESVFSSNNNFVLAAVHKTHMFAYHNKELHHSPNIGTALIVNRDHFPGTSC